jgi:hypothetical protein
LRQASGESVHIFSPAARALPSAAPMASRVLDQIAAGGEEPKPESSGQGNKANTIESQNAARIRNHIDRPPGARSQKGADFLDQIMR